MSFFETLFRPIGKWNENPERKDENDAPNEEMQTIDKIERIQMDEIEEITIAGNMNIMISSLESKEIIVRIHGLTTTNYVLDDIYVTKVNKGLLINAKGRVDNKSESKQEGDTNSSFANITLDVIIPEEVILKKIQIRNSNGDIICKSTINADLIEVKNRNGGTQINAIFQKISIDSKYGNVCVKTGAKSDLDVVITNTEGTVNLNLANIKHAYMQYEIDGGCLVQPSYFGEHDVYGKIHINKGSLVYS